MKIAITSLEPNLNSQIDDRFGRSKYIIILDSETNAYEIIDNSENANALQGAGIQTAQKVAEKGVTQVITGHIGPKASKVLELAKIQAITEVTGTVQEAFEAFKSGKPKEIDTRNN